MPDPTTTNYSFTKPTVGSDVDTWGGLYNDTMDAIDTAIKAVSDVADAAVPATGGTMSGALTVNDNVHAKTETAAHHDLGSVSGAQTLDLSVANSFSLTCSGAVTLSLSNVPTTGKLVPLFVEINDGAAGVTWFTGAKFPGGSGGAPILTSGKDLIAFVTRDGGTTWNYVGSQLNDS